MLIDHNNESIDFNSLEQEVGVPDWQGAIVDEAALSEGALSGDFKATYSAWFNPDHEQYAGMSQEGMTKSFLERASFVRQKHFEDQALQPVDDYLIVLLADRPGFEIRKRVETEVEDTEIAIGRTGLLGSTA